MNAGCCFFFLKSLATEIWPHNVHWKTWRRRATMARCCSRKGSAEHWGVSRSDQSQKGWKKPPNHLCFYTFLPSSKLQARSTSHSLFGKPIFSTLLGHGWQNHTQLTWLHSPRHYLSRAPDIIFQFQTPPHCAEQLTSTGVPQKWKGQNGALGTRFSSDIKIKDAFQIITNEQ